MAEFPLSITANAEQLEKLFGRIRSSAPMAGRAVDKVSDRSARSSQEARSASRSFQNLAKTYDGTTRATRSAARETKTLTDRTERLRRSTDQQAASSDKLSRVSGRLAAQLVGVAAGVLSVATAAREIRSALDTFSELETGLISVGKTTDLTTDQLDTLFDRLADRTTTDIPVALSRMLDIGEAAGQLGVQGVDDLEAFVTTLSKMEVASDVVGQQGAKNLARILGVTGEATDRVETLGSAIVALGNTVRASESEIVEHTTAIASANAMFDIGSTQAAAYGATLAALGQASQVSGSSVFRAVAMIEDAVLSGGQKLEFLADVAGVSAKEMSEAFGRDAFEAFQLFLEGLAQVEERGTTMTQVMDQLGLSDLRVLRIIPVLAKAHGELAENIATVAEEEREATALNKEASRFFARFQGDVDRFTNNLTLLRREYGEELAPAVREAMGELTEFFDESRDGAAEFGEEVGEAFTAVAKAAIFVGRNLDVLQSAVVALIALKLAQSISGWVTQLDKFAATIGTSKANTVGFLDTGIRPLTAGLGALLGVVLLLNEAVEDWGDRMDREMARILEQTNQFGERTRGVQRDVERLLDAARLQAEFEDELLRQGIEDPESDRALRVRERLEADFHRNRVDRLLEMRDRLEKVREEREKLNERMTEIEETEIPAARQRREEAGVPEMPQFQQAEKDLAKLQDELLETGVEIRNLTTEEKILQQDLPKLEAATQDYAAANRDASGSLDDLGGSGDEAAQKLQQLITSLETQRDLALELAAAREIDDEEAQRSALERLETEERFLQVTSELTAEQTQKLRELGLVQEVVAAERKASGAETLDALRKEAEGLQGALAVRHEGLAAVETELKQLELEKRQREASARAAGDQKQEIEDLTARIDDYRRELELLAKTTALDEQIEDFNTLAVAYDHSLGLGQEVQRQLEAEAAIRQAVAGATETEAEALMKRARALEVARAGASASEMVANLEDELEHTEKLSKVKREDFLTERRYREALRQVNVEREIRIQLLAIEAERAAAVAAINADESIGFAEKLSQIEATNDQFDEMVRRAARAMRAQAALDREMETGQGPTIMEEWVTAADMLASALDEIDSGLAGVVRSATDAVIAFSNMAEEGGKVNAAVAGFNVLGAIGGAATGGKNFAAEGAAAGAVIGAIVGSIFPGVGTAAGAQIGASAGGAIGSFIKEGADEFLGTVKQEADGTLHANMRKAEAEMGAIGNRFMEGIIRGMEKALDQLGAISSDLPDIEIKAREGVFSVLVGGVKARFESMDAAIDFAIVQALKQGEITGLSPEVKAALENTTAETMRDLFDDIEFAKFVENLPDIGQRATQAGQAIRDLVDEFFSAIRRAEELGIARGKIDQWLLHSLESIRNNVLGIVESNEERIRREARAFNAELKMAQAEMELRKTELQAKAETIAVEGDLASKNLELNQLLIDGEHALLIARIESGKAVGELTKAQLQELKAVSQAILAIEENIAAMDELLISDAEIQDAINRAGSAGADQRKREREEFRAEVEDLHAAAMGVSDDVIELRNTFDEIDKWVEAARELGFAEEELARARGLRLDAETRDFLEPFRETIEEARRTGLGGEIEGVLDRFTDAMDAAFVLAEERADAFGTSVGHEFDKISAVIREAIGIELAGVLRDALVSAVDAGDLEAVQAVRDALADIPHELKPETLEALGASAGEMRDAIEEARDTFLESVQEYLDAAEGIGEFERRLIDLQKTFRDARDGVTAAGEAMDLLSGLPEGQEDETPSNLFMKGIEPALDDLADAARGTFEQIADDLQNTFGVDIPIDGDADLPREPGQRPEGPFEKSTNVLGPGSAQEIEDVGDAMGGVSDASDQLADDLARLEAAERRAIQQIGVEFIRSLDDLGVSLPTGLTLELAEAQFELARAEAISSALALAAAGAFDEISLSVADLLDMIAGADFGQSRFAPGEDGAGGRRGRSGGGRERDLENLKRRVEEQIQAWNRMPLGDATQEAIQLAESLIQVKHDAEEAGVSLDRVSEAYQRAVRTFVDDALEEFEEMDLSPLERELDSIQDRFVDLLVAFETAGASAEDMARLQDAFSTAMEDFLERATEGLRALAEELRREDPRVSPASSFQSAQSDFRDVLARAQEGDLGAIEELEEVARRFREESLSFLGGGVGTNVVLDEILGGLDSIEDLELVPQDIAVLQDQADSLLELIELQEAQASGSETRAGFDGVRRSVDSTRDSVDRAGDFLAQILSELEDGELSIAMLPDVLEALNLLANDVGFLPENVGDIIDALTGVLAVSDDLTQGELDNLLGAVSGVLTVADELGPDQLDKLVGLFAKISSMENLSDDQVDQLQGLARTLLDVEGLTDQQRQVLSGILDDSGENILVTKQGRDVQEPLLRSMNIRIGDMRVTLHEIRDLLADMPSMQSGGLTSDDGLVFLHQGERVLNPRDTAVFDALFRASGRSADPIVVSRETAASVQRSVRPEGRRSTGGTTTGEHLTPEVVVERQAERDAAHLESVRRSIERAEDRRHNDQRAAAKLAAARIRQGGGELELLAELAAEVAALRREAKRGARGTAGRSN